MMYGTDGNKISYESCIGPTRFRILNKRPHQGYSWVDGRLTKTPVTSRPQAIWPDVWLSVPKCAQNKARATNGTLTDSKFKVHARRG